MKIVFLCSSLEPGRDGVGDYTRRLAAELIRQGHVSSALSLSDKYIFDKVKSIQISEGINLPVLRLPSSWALKDRVKHAKEYIENFDPEWLSLQFVIFGFHPKGLPFGLSSQLAFLGSGRKWHIMFHELWLGMEIQSSIKHTLWGRLQRLVIKSLISALNPQVISTHTVLYQRELAKMGFDAKQLPLFSNIPKVYDNSNRLTLAQSIKTNKPIDFILFGNIHPNAPIGDFANEVATYAAINKIGVSLTIVGRCGNDQMRWADIWTAAGLKVNILGEQPVNNISKALSIASIGISTTPVALIEKSGSVAAMLEHGLTVICVPFLWQPKNFRDIKFPAGILTYQKGNLEYIFAGEFDLPISNNVSVISLQLVNSLLNRLEYGKYKLPLVT